MISARRFGSSLALVAFASLLSLAIACGDSNSNGNGGGLTSNTSGNDTSGTSSFFTNTGGGNTTDTSGGGATGGETTSGNTTTGGSDNEAMCADTSHARNGFTRDFEQASAPQYGFEYVASTSEDSPFDIIRVQIYNGYDNTPEGPGEYSLDGINYRDCGLCVLAFSDCDGEQCAKTFYAEQGTVDIAKLEGPGGNFAAALEGVVFDEVTIDENYVSTPVSGGETWCIDGYEFDQEISDPNAAQCSQPGINCVGDTVPDFSLRNCEDSGMFSVQEMGQDQKAIWIVLTAGWCPACKQWLPQVIDIEKQYADQGLKVLYIMGEDNNYGEPSRSECADYVNDHYDAEVNQFFLDHDGEYSFATTFANMWPYVDANGAFGLPWNAVIDPRTMEFVYADGSGQPESLETVLNDLLARD